MKPKSTARLSFPLATAIAALLATPAAHATILTWDGDTSVTWATAGNWAGGVAPTNDITTDIAKFDLATYTFQPTATSNGNINGLIMGGSSGAITITTLLTTNRLNIGTGGILMDAGTGTLTIGAAATQGATLGASQSWTNNSSNLLTVSSVANDANVTPFTLTLDGSGSGGITISNIIANGGAIGTTALIVNMSGTGGVTLSGANTLTGGIALNQGTLVATVAGGFGTSANTLKFGGGNLELRQASGVLAGTTFNGKIDMTTAGTTVTVNRTDNPATVTTHSIGGATTLGDGQTMVMSSGANIADDTAYGLTLSGAKTFGAPNSNATFTINGNGSGNGTLSLITGTIDTGGNTQTLTFNTGTGTGANKAVISGAFTGTAGTLVLAGSAPVTVTLTTSANALQINSTTGGVYTLGNSGFTGGLTLTSGRILIPGTGNLTLGPFGNGGTFTINDGIIDSSGGVKVVSHVNPITIGGDFAYSTSAGAAIDDVTLPGAITMAADRTVTLNGLGALTLSGKLTNTSDSVRTLTVNNGTGTDAGSILTIGSYDLTGPGSTAARNNIINGSGRVTISGVIADGVSSGSGLTYSGTGTLTLRGSNTYSGTTTISEGTLQAGAAAGGQAFGNGSAVTLADTAGATLNLNSFSQTIGSLAGGGSTGGNVTLGTGTLTTGGNNASTAFGGVISSTSSAGGLTKTGAGTLTLTGTNTYDGATAVNLGTLFINGDQTSANGAITVASTATLGGIGTIGGATTIQSGGFYSPGNSSGTLNHAAGLTLAAGSIFNWENNTTNTLGTGGADWDVANITSGVRTLDPTATTGSQLRLQFSNAGTDFTDTFWNSDQTWDFITGGSGANAFDATNISIWINGVQQGSNNTITGQGTFTTIVSGGNLQLVWEAALPVIPTAYWAGATDGDWGTLNNWRDAASGPGAVISSAPNVGTDVHFSTTDPVPGNLGAVNLAADFAVKTLAFDAASTATTIGSTDAFTLTIAPPTSTNGIVVDSGADATNTLNVKVALAGNQTWTVGGTNTLVANGIISGAFSLTKDDSGTLTVTGTNTYTGATAIDAGTLLVNGSLAAGAVTVNAGTLGGTGTISGTVTIGNSSGSADSILAPGNSIESLDTGNLTFNSDGSYSVELNDSSVTTDVTNVTGTVSINAATTLTVSVADTLSASQQFVIVSNDDTDAVTGTFAGLAQNAVVGNYGGTDLKISYTGGDGNDIVLYTDAPFIPTAYWSGSTDGDWGTLNNWNDAATAGAAISSLPNAGTDVHFSTVSPVPGNLGAVNLAADFAIKTLSFDAASSAVTIGSGTSNTLTITPGASTDGISVDTAAGDNTLTTKVALGADQTWTVGAARTLTASNDVSGGFSLTKAGAGALSLTGSNSYSGGTTVSDGTLALSGGNNTLADAGAVNLSNSGVTFDISAVTTSETIGSLAGVAGSSVVLGSKDLTVGDGSNTDFAGVISGTSGSLTKLGAGTQTLSGTNTYTGNTTVSAGTLSVGATANLGGAAANLVFDGGMLQVTGMALTSFTGIGHSVSFNLNKDVRLDIADAANTFTVDQVLNMGTGRFYKFGPGTVILDQVNTFMPGAGQYSRVSRGTLLATKFASLPGVAEDKWYVGTDNTLAVRALEASPNGEWTSANLDALLGGTLTTDAFQDGSFLGIEVTGANSFAYANDIAGTSYAHPLNSQKGLVKLGTGTLTLSGTNTYTGATAVSAGTLSVTGSLGATTVSVNAGTLAGNGNIGGNVTIASGATHALAVAATLGTQDTSVISGTLTLTAGNILDLTAATTPAAGEYVLATASVAITGTPTVNYNGITGTVSVDTTSSPNRLLLTVTSGSPYDTWATAKGLTGDPGFENAKDADPDNDGSNNLAEFALDGNPLSGANDGKVVGKVATVGGNQVMTLTLPVRAVASFSPDSGDQLSALIDGIYYRVEGDVSLSTFADTITEVTGTDATNIQTGLPGLSGAGWSYRTFRAPGTVPVDPKAFLRAKISETP